MAIKRLFGPVVELRSHIAFCRFCRSANCLINCLCTLLSFSSGHQDPEMLSIIAHGADLSRCLPHGLSRDIVAL